MEALVGFLGIFVILAVASLLGWLFLKNVEKPHWDEYEFSASAIIFYIFVFVGVSAIMFMAGTIVYGISLGAIAFGKEILSIF